MDNLNLISNFAEFKEILRRIAVQHVHDKYVESRKRRQIKEIARLRLLECGQFAVKILRLPGNPRRLRQPRFPALEIVGCPCGRQHGRRLSAAFEKFGVNRVRQFEFLLRDNLGGIKKSVLPIPGEDGIAPFLDNIA